MATDTFKESILPICGMEKVMSDLSRKILFTPLPSFPIITARGTRVSISETERGAFAALVAIQYPDFFSGMIV